MSGAGRRADPVEEYADAYAAALSAALRGPARAKARMVAEIRDGLADTADAHASGGLPREDAVRQAVREFGTVADLVPECQRELTAVQARHTARTVLLTVPPLTVCWYLLLTAGHGTGPPYAVRWLAAPFAGSAAATALLAAAALAATGPLARRLPAPRRLPLVSAWTGTAAGVTMALATLALTLASAVSAPAGAAWPLLALGAALTFASHAVVASSARACRRCARA